MEITENEYEIVGATEVNSWNIKDRYSKSYNELTNTMSKIQDIVDTLDLSEDDSDEYMDLLNDYTVVIYKMIGNEEVYIELMKKNISYVDIAAKVVFVRIQELNDLQLRADPLLDCLSLTIPEVCAWSF